MSRCAAALLLLTLAACGRGAAATPETVEVAVGGEQVAVRPTQYCLDGEGQRYRNTPPVLEVSPDSTITLTVPDSVAKRGWSVQVFDQKLEEPIGEVAVPHGKAVFDGINTSDVALPARMNPTGHAPENAPQAPPLLSTTTR